MEFWGKMEVRWLLEVRPCFSACHRPLHSCGFPSSPCCPSLHLSVVDVRICTPDLATFKISFSPLCYFYIVINQSQDSRHWRTYFEVFSVVVWRVLKGSSLAEEWLGRKWWHKHGLPVMDLGILSNWIVAWPMRKSVFLRSEQVSPKCCCKVGSRHQDSRYQILLYTCYAINKQCDRW